MQSKINVLEWPGNSPDINPIENLWLVMKKKVEDTHEGSVGQSIVDNDVCHRLVESLPSRLREVIRNKGCSLY